MTILQYLRALLNFSRGFPILGPLMAGPLPLIILPLAMAPIVYLLRRWPVAASLSASVTTFVTAGLCLRLPLNAPTYVLGREFALDYPSRMVIVFILVTAAILFLCAWLTSVQAHPEHSRRVQDTAFIPFGLAILGLLSGVIMIRLFLFAALLLEIAAIVAVFAIQSDQQGSERVEGLRPERVEGLRPERVEGLRPERVEGLRPERVEGLRPERVACPEHSLREGQGSTQAGLRYLVMTTLALPCFLVAAWLFELHARHPHNAALAEPAVTLLALGFAILLGTVPFQAWLPAVTVKAPPMVTAFLLGTVHPVLFLLLTSLFQRNPWLIADNQAFQLLTMGGLLTALVGGLLALGQRDFGRLLAYAVLSDLGCLLLGLGAASVEGLAAATLQLVNRSLALTLACAGLATMRHYASSDAFADLGNIARRMPLVSAGLLTGLLSLSGFPLTGGFASRWPIYRLVYQKNPLYAIALALSGGAAALGCWRGLLALLGSGAHPELDREPIPRLQYLPTAVVMLILTLLCLTLGLFPQSFLPPILKWVEGFTFLGHLR